MMDIRTRKSILSWGLIIFLGFSNLNLVAQSEDDDYEEVYEEDYVEKEYKYWSNQKEMDLILVL